MHTFEVSNILGDFCVTRIQQAIMCLDVEAQVKINRDENRITVFSDQSPKMLREALSDSGFPALA